MWAKHSEDIPQGAYITYFGGYINNDGSNGMFLSYELSETCDWLGLRWHDDSNK